MPCMLAAWACADLQASLRAPLTLCAGLHSLLPRVIDVLEEKRWDGWPQVEGRAL